MNIFLRCSCFQKTFIGIFSVLLFSTYSRSQSTCTSITANACTGANVSQDFNTGNGSFSSASFTYSAANGWWQVTNVLLARSYSITSPAYRLNGNIATIGFFLDKKGGGSCNFSSAATIAIADNATGTILAQCNASIVAGQVCTNISDVNLVAGADVKFIISFTFAGVCGLGTKFAFDNFSVGASAIIVPIPVKLTSFSASRKDNTVNLKWQTASEFNNKGFEVQRKLQGDEGFETVGIVHPKYADGNSNDLLSYEFNDLNISAGPSQYQLKQNDFDGKYEFSHILTVPGSRSSERVLIYPNPSGEGQVNIIFSSFGQRNIQLSDISGRMQQAWNKYASGSLQLRRLKPGIYLLSIADLSTNEKQVKKIVVL